VQGYRNAGWDFPSHFDLPTILLVNEVEPDTYRTIVQLMTHVDTEEVWLGDTFFAAAAGGFAGADDGAADDGADAVAAAAQSNNT
jgi:hypothetical protein